MKTRGSKSYLALFAVAVLSVSCSDAAGPDPDPDPNGELGGTWPS